MPLHRAAGWSYGHDPLMPRVLLTSPDQLTQLRLDPDPDDPGWWTIRHARTADHPGWTATFEARTPVEIIAAFTDAMADPSGPPTAALDPCAPLRDAGWDTPRPSAALPPPTTSRASGGSAPPAGICGASRPRSSRTRRSGGPCSPAPPRCT
ncbi:DUF317 domain-containing protein [Streptomyces sp. NBC_00554]|uniref:DUF317 domain-containing protein n=1 Tax=Streptomyces sp. NBC_00554 TaxID=2903661 RepID=UPI00352F9423|nr:DUF317 domain-containing protein [Streptomyces sp. NBC_00554]